MKRGGRVKKHRQTIGRTNAEVSRWAEEILKQGPPQSKKGGGDDKSSGGNLGRSETPEPGGTCERGKGRVEKWVKRGVGLVKGGEGGQAAGKNLG